MLMKDTAIEIIPRGSQVSYFYMGAESERLCHCTSRDEMVSGVAARDISLGEVLEIDSAGGRASLAPSSNPRVNNLGD